MSVMVSISVLAGSQWVGLLFLVTGVAKAAKASDFVLVVRNFGILPSALATPFGFGLPYVEIALAVSLLTGFLLSFSIPITIVLLLLFSLSQIKVLFQARDVSCGCFGTLSDRPITWRNIRNNGVLILALIIIWQCTAAPGSLVSINRLAPTTLDNLVIRLTVTGIFTQMFVIDKLREFVQQERLIELARIQTAEARVVKRLAT